MTMWNKLSDKIKTWNEELTKAKNVKQSCEFIKNYKEKFEKNLELKINRPKDFDTKPKDFKEPQKPSEKRYQWVIRNKQKVTCDNKTNINWLDYEIPVSFEEQGRRECIDLIGLMDKRIALVELKWGNKTSKYKSYSPLYALFEVLHYAINAYKNQRCLTKNNVYRKDGTYNYWKTMKFFPNIIVAANKDYWVMWEKSYKNQIWKEFKDMVKHIKGKLPDGACIYLFQFSNEEASCSNWQNVL